MTSPIIAQISEALRAEADLEGVVRRFLALIQIVTGLEATYLTRIDMAEGRQTVMFSCNSTSFAIPEGLSVPWGDTLCKRALDDGCPFANDVPLRWGDSAAARALGIQTYLSTPVLLDHELYGTLCGASAGCHTLAPEIRQLLTLFGEIISLYLEKDRALATLDHLNRQLEISALTDPLTGLPNRRFMMREIERQLMLAGRTRQDLFVAFIDLDDFKTINDTHGHEAGDAFLAEIGRRLLASVRGDDVAGRIGGDEFLVCGSCHAAAPAAPADPVQTVVDRLVRALSGRFDLGRTTLAYNGPSVGAVRIAPDSTTAEDAIRRADAAMYAEKLRRKARRKRAAAAMPDSTPGPA